jgi:hypothetical protein
MLRQTKKVIGREVEAAFFVDKQKQVMWVTNTPAALSGGGSVQREDALTSAINQVCLARAPLAIAPLLRASAADSDRVAETLALPHMELHAMRGVSGEPVITSDLDLLRMQPSRPFHDGEIVAYENECVRKDARSQPISLPSTSYSYGKIIIADAGAGAGAVHSDRFNGLQARCSRSLHRCALCEDVCRIGSRTCC